jgi:hypothetical protein
VEIASAANVALQKLRCYKGIMQGDSLRLLTNQQLLTDVAAVAAQERETTARLIRLLSEVDSRRLYLGEGYSSLFTFCTQRLRFSEHAAYGRIEAARAGRKFPLVFDLLANGSVTLTTICLLAPHLTEENHRRLLAASTHQSKRQVEELIAALRPQPTVPSMVRKLPTSTAVPRSASAMESGEADPANAMSPLSPGVAAPQVASVPRTVPGVVRPLAPERYKVQLTITSETHDKLRKVQDLLRHVVPSGDPAVIFDRAVTLLLRDLERQKLASVDRPRTGTTPASHGRHVPAAVRRAVWERDGGRCGFVGTDGRCQERGFLEFHHVVPFARGGGTSVDNLELRCRAHNAYEGRMEFEPNHVRESPALYQLGPDRVAPAGRTQATSLAIAR